MFLTSLRFTNLIRTSIYLLEKRWLKNQNIVRDIISKEINDDVALMLFEHYCSNMVEAINGYVPTTRDNVDIVTAFYYDVCDEAAKRVDNVD